MKIVKVTYTTTEAFAAQNQNNIQTVMTDLKNANRQGINYNACLCADNKTFIHTAFFKSDDDQRFLNELSSFKSFQEQLKASSLETPPKQEMLTLIGTSATIF
jgi:hypothetical protein